MASILFFFNHPIQAVEIIDIETDKSIAKPQALKKVYTQIYSYTFLCCLGKHIMNPIHPLIETAKSCEL